MTITIVHSPLWTGKLLYILKQTLLLITHKPECINISDQLCPTKIDFESNYVTILARDVH